MKVKPADDATQRKDEKVESTKAEIKIVHPEVQDTTAEQDVVIKSTDNEHQKTPSSGEVGSKAGQSNRDHLLKGDVDKPKPPPEEKANSGNSPAEHHVSPSQISKRRSSFLKYSSASLPPLVEEPASIREQPSTATKLANQAEDEDILVSAKNLEKELSESSSDDDDELVNSVMGNDFITIGGLSQPAFSHSLINLCSSG
jgi:hypothetical protein